MQHICRKDKISCVPLGLSQPTWSKQPQASDIGLPGTICLSMKSRAAEMALKRLLLHWML